MLPNTVTTVRLEHDFWEEVFVVRGDYEAFDPATGKATDLSPMAAATPVGRRANRTAPSVPKAARCCSKSSSYDETART